MMGAADWRPPSCKEPWRLCLHPTWSTSRGCWTTPNASRWCASIAGRSACAVTGAAMTRWSATGAMTHNLTGTALAGHHQPLRVWVLCLYFMGLNLSNRQIAEELGLNASDVQAMTEQLRRGLVAKAAAVRLEGEVEIDEVYVVAGHKGQHEAVAKRGGSDAVAGWQVHRAGAR